MKKTNKIIRGKIVDVINKSIYNGEVVIEGDNIKEINKVNKDFPNYIMPGLIDAHIHIESSMLIPSEFAKIAVRHGTVATVSDPHEIANVLGNKGIEFMLQNAETVPFKFYFGAPSCVPATMYETSGATITANDILKLLKKDNIHYLAEVMNYPGVIYDDQEVHDKIKYAIILNKPIDGHAPGLTGDELAKYASAGITTDHESFTLDEAIEKIELGMKLLIREGSAAKNFTALYKAINLYPSEVMLCTDDSHPDDLLIGHINTLIKRALRFDVQLFNVLRAATLNPIKHYNLDVGLLQEGDPADFIIVDDFKTFNIKQTYINGQLVFDNGTVLINAKNTNIINNFKCQPVQEMDIRISANSDKINVIEAIDGELITNKLVIKPRVFNGFIESDTKRDILKIVVVNRYTKISKIQVGFIRNFNLTKGAIASSIAHDSHNIIAVGTSDKDITTAINTLIENKGGIAVVDGQKVECLKLEIAGIMSNKDGEYVAKKYKELDLAAKKLGCKLSSPFMTLSFMALLVIPKLKIGDKGLFDVEQFALTTTTL